MSCPPLLCLLALSSYQGLDYAQSPWMREAGVSVRPNPLQLNGRSLRPPAVQYGGRSLVCIKLLVIPYHIDPLVLKDVRDGAWNVLGQQFLKPATIVCWAVVSFDNGPNAPQAVQNFATMLYGCLAKLGKYPVIWSSRFSHDLCPHV